MLKKSISDGERLSQEHLSQCAGLGASVPVSGQKPGRFQVIYQEHVLLANQLQVVTKEVVETARQNLIIGPG